MKLLRGHIRVEGHVLYPTHKVILRFGTLWLQFIMYKLRFSTGNKAVNRSVAGAVGSGLAAWNANYVVLLVPHTEKRKKVPENYPCWGQLDLNSFQHRLRLFCPAKTMWIAGQSFYKHVVQLQARCIYCPPLVIQEVVIYSLQPLVVLQDPAFFLMQCKTKSELEG